MTTLSKIYCVVSMAFGGDEVRAVEAGYAISPDGNVSAQGEGPDFARAKDAVRFAHGFAVRTGLKVGVVVMARRFLVVKPDTMELEPYGHYYGGRTPWAHHALRIAAHYIMGERLSWRRCTRCYVPTHQVGNCPEMF